MTRKVTLGLAQVEPVLGEMQTNVEKVLRFTTEAAQRGAELVIFPELVLTGYHPQLLGERLLTLALRGGDEPLQRLAKAAGEHQVYLVFGFIEQRTVPGVLYNSIAICGPDGRVLSTYAKSHLFSAENLYFRPGTDLGVLPMNFGVVAPMICMDIGYPEVARILALQGAELLFAPSAWIKEDDDLWPLHLRARALDNLAFVAGINRVGTEGNLHFIGQSMVCDPRGHILAELGGEEGLLVTQIDLDEVALARRRALHWTGRRPELYRAIAEEQM